MRKVLISVAIAVVVIAMASLAFAAGSTTASVTVNAKVGGICKNTVDGVFTTLTIDPSGGDQPFLVTTDATVQCTKNLTTTSITATSANGTAINQACNSSYQTGFTMKDASLSTINYSFACNTSVTGNGFGASPNVSLGMGAKVLAADAATASYDSGATYSDTITLTINY